MLRFRPPSGPVVGCEKLPELSRSNGHPSPWEMEVFVGLASACRGTPLRCQDRPEEKSILASLVPRYPT
jgi:hypothetical protein